MNAKRIGVLAGLISILVSPVGLILVVLIVEKRPFVVADQYMAFLVGDVLLGIAVGVGFTQLGDRSPWSWWLIFPLVAGIAFGWWQLGHEIAEGTYTRAEGYSPSKLYHQFVCYPVLGALVLRSAYLAKGARKSIAVITVLVACWIGTNVWDWHHPKHPHTDSSESKDNW